MSDGAGGPLRIATWSGPRNISTAMMRAWENRPDTVVVDEPLYAHYLAATGIDHPMREEVIAAGETDWRAVVAALTGPAPSGARIVYQKQMAHHLLPGVGRDWLARVTNCFLIRDPADVAVSYARARAAPTAEDLGFPQQAEIFDQIRVSTGGVPLVIDATEFLADPEGMLRAWCMRMEIDFDARMLSWPPGPRDSDGVWAPHWYAAVRRSTGFAPPSPRRVETPAGLRSVVERCRPYYESLRAWRLRPGAGS